MIPDDVTLTDGYNSVEDIATHVIEGSAEAQDCTTEELEEIPITAIDEVEMSKAIENDDEISQESWDYMRRAIKVEVEHRGYNIL